jgi:EmrB/QacA subfamily drug resistance transporter
MATETQTPVVDPPSRGATLAEPLLLGVLFSAGFMIVLDVFIVNVAAPAMQRDLGATPSDVQWVLTAYLLAYATGLISGGRIGDYYGRRRAFRGGLLLFTAASAACAAAPTPGALIGARVVQGLGAALMFPQVFSIIQVQFAPAERPRRLAIMGGVQGAAAISGQLLGGALITLDIAGLNWRWVFLVNVPVGLFGYLLAGSAIPESRAPNAARLDLAGVAVGSTLMLLLALPIVEGRELGWPLWTLLCLAAVLPLGAAFVQLERRVGRSGGAPLLHLPLFARRGFTLGLVAALVVYCIVTFFLLLSLYLQDGMGLDAMQSGLAFLPLTIGFVVSSLLFPRVAAHVGVPLPVVGALVVATGVSASALVVALEGAHFAAPLVIAASTPVGLGMGLLVPPLIGIVLAEVPVEDAGAASGMYATATQIGNAFGAAIVSGVFFAVLGDGEAAADYAQAFSVATLVQVVAAFGCALLVLQIRRGQPVTRRT